MKAKGKQVWFMLLAVLTVLIMVPRTAKPVYAEDFQLWVGGVQVTSTNTSGPGWSYSGNASKGTLTLTKANITGIHDTGWTTANIYINGIDLTVELIGSNSLSGAERSISSQSGRLTITGGGSLDAGGTTTGIRTVSGGLTVTGGCTITSSGQNGILSDDFITIEDNSQIIAKNYGISCKAALTITDSRVDVSDATNYGINSSAALTITNSTVDVSTSGYYGINSGGAMEISDSAVSSSAKNCGLFFKGGITIGDGLAIIEPEGGQVRSDGWTIVANGTMAKTVLIGKPGTVDVQASPAAGGTVTGGRMYLIDSAATVKATPNPEYVFVNWTENGKEVSKDAIYSFTVTGARTLTANFADAYSTITFTDEDGTVLQSDKVAYGETPSYTGKTPAKPETDQYTYTFAGWDPEITAVKGDATYKALYTSTKKEEPTQQPKEETPQVAEPASKAIAPLLAKMTAKGSKSLVLSWNKVDGAEGYDIFFTKCSSKESNKSFKKVKTVKGNKTLKWTKKGLKAKTSYKAYVNAWVMKDGKKSYMISSPIVHAFTSGSTEKYTNAKSVTVNKAKVAIKKGKTFKLKAGVKTLKKNRKLMPKTHGPVLRYVSTDKAIATVNKSGKIKGVSKGSCYVYAYAHNGVSKKVKVTVS